MNVVFRVLMTIVGCILLLPGLCGTLTFAVSLLGPSNPVFGISRALQVLVFTVPSIQLGCLGLWLLAVKSNKMWLRQLTHYAGMFGAFSFGLFLFCVIMLVCFSPDFFKFVNWSGPDRLVIPLIVISFLLGGLPALLLKPYPEIRERSVGDKEHP
jgi:hypothetical protein